MESPRVAARKVAAQRLTARYDGAATTTDNARHWANADMLSADAANSPDVRARLRSRCRYECWESNAFCNGIVKTLANYLIGPGPRLKLQSPNRTLNAEVQRSFGRWMREVRLPAKLRTLRMAKAVDGEAIALLATNKHLRHEVKLDLRLREADQMTTPQLLMGLERNRIDGIDFHEDGETPRQYQFLKDHPGSNVIWADSLTSTPISAQYVIHWFRQDRAGQHRGIPELAPALPLFALVRRYVLAVLAAAETAAEFAAVMYTDQPGVEPGDVDPMDVIELEMRAMLTLPQGWKIGQVKAEQPTTTFEMFRNALWQEAARCVLMPFAVASGNSANLNFASGRLDHQAFDLAIDTDRDDCEAVVLARIFEAWLREYLSIRSGIAAVDINLDLYQQYRWYWPPREHVDPQKQATAIDTMWQAGHISDDDIQFERGVDPEEHYEAMQRQQERRRRLGMPMPGESGPQPFGGESAEDRRERFDEQGDEEDVPAEAAA